MNGYFITTTVHERPAVKVKTPLEAKSSSVDEDKPLPDGTAKSSPDGAAWQEAVL